MSVRERVDAALAGVPQDWRTSLAQTLASAMDGEPNASMARELRSVMADIDAEKPQAGGTGLDELERRRAARGAATAS